MNVSLLVGLSVTFLGVLVLFSVYPQIDLWFSGLFFSPQEGFWLGSSPALQAIRIAFWYLPHIFLTFSVVFLLLPIGPSRHISKRIWGFVLVFLLLGPGILVNLVLKEHWGRARPADVLIFGGEAYFTPALAISSECARNCSFVSGEGATIVTLALIIGIVFWHQVPASRRAGFVTILAIVAASIAGLRVVKGRHFLSDILIGAFLMAIVALLLFYLMRIGAVRRTATWANLKADIRLLSRFARSEK